MRLAVTLLLVLVWSLSSGWVYGRLFFKRDPVEFYAGLAALSMTNAYLMWRLLW